MPVCLICLENIGDGVATISCETCHAECCRDCLQTGWFNRSCPHCRSGVMLPCNVEDPLPQRQRITIGQFYPTDSIPICCFDRAMRFRPTHGNYDCLICTRIITRRHLMILAEAVEHDRASAICPIHGQKALIVDLPHNVRRHTGFIECYWRCIRIVPEDDDTGAVAEIIECNGEHRLD